MHVKRVMCVLVAATAVLTGLAAPASAAPVTLRFVTANVDFGVSQANVRQDWQNVIAPHADIALLQETKSIRLADFVDTGTWLVLQDTSAEDRAGSALVIRRSVFTDRDTFGLVKGVDASPCPDGGIMTRWIAKVNIRLNNGRWIRVASLHMPPPRCQTGPGSPYDDMGFSIVNFVRGSDRLTVLGADWNKVVDDDPNDIAARANLEPNGPNDGLRIDGFMYSRSLDNCCLARLAAIHSEHRPIQIKMTIPS
ncbi:hypothetical protein Cme02nite_28610 [Catellatospora methionotrophica]|uniref:Endonuclease/exonuclease/phosphatase domain-containing protein n=1 Tax=Catellatospora methionotrophica TaxID=121620 RepID=A0A8J3LFF2_9ACTN|nr:endonuclease/exonuclease/phosphatase family protein [Catellatospora methionotrophica]GIG14529.1 hypothetical protein Cme02nite_28610 [Catellatospora methionotrophica]